MQGKQLRMHKTCTELNLQPHTRYITCMYVSVAAGRAFNLFSLLYSCWLPPQRLCLLRFFISNIFLILLLNLSVLTTSLSTTTTRSKREVPGSIPGTHYRNFIISKSSQICSFGGLWLRLVNIQMVRRNVK